MRQCCLRMSKDPIAQAREALREAGALVPTLERPASAALARALEQVARSLDSMESAEARIAAQLALLDDRLLRIENNRVFAAWRSIMRMLGRLRRNADRAQAQAYQVWVAHEQAAQPSPAEARAVSGAWRRQPSFAVLPVRPGIAAGRDFSRSLEAQSYGRYVLCPDALSPADSEYVCLVDAEGELSPLALHYFAEAVQAADADLLYCDEDRIDAEGNRSGPVFRPDWSPDLLTSCFYTGSLLVISRRLLLETGGHGPNQLHDLALRAADSGGTVFHVPRILFHREAPPPDAPEATRAVIHDTLVRREGTAAEVMPGPVAGSFLIRRQGQTPEITAVVCSKSPGLLSACLESLRSTAPAAIRKIVIVAHEEHGLNPELRQVAQRYGAEVVPYAGPFNFAVMNNLGASHASSPHLLFLNDDVRATSAGWAEILVSHLFTERIGVAGAVLRYPSGDIQHAGIVTGITDGAGHAGRYTAGSELWPWLLMTRNVSAVTGACLAIRAATFRGLGGFDPEFPNNYNDVDLCLRAREAGLDIVCVAAPGLIHAECQTRPGLVRFQERYRLFQRWGHLLSRPDPYYSPSLAPSEQIVLDLGSGGGYRPLLAGRKS